MWSALTADARQDKETFYTSQQRTTTGFMSYAKTTLELLITLTGDKDIVSQGAASGHIHVHLLKASSTMNDVPPSPLSLCCHTVHAAALHLRPSFRTSSPKSLAISTNTRTCTITPPPLPIS